MGISAWERFPLGLGTFPVSFWHGSEIAYQEIGCIHSRFSANVSAYYDETCINGTESPCRDGLPFFFSKVASAMMPEGCFHFCLRKGLDLFGILSQMECRCGATRANSAAWHLKEPQVKLLLPLTSLVACTGSESLQVYRYSGHLEGFSEPANKLNLHEYDLA